jgi:hypothetical protein
VFRWARGAEGWLNVSWSIHFIVYKAGAVRMILAAMSRKRLSGVFHWQELGGAGCSNRRRYFESCAEVQKRLPHFVG